MIRELFFKNASLKLISIILAILLELYFYSPENYVTQEVSAGVSIINVPSTLMIVEPEGAEQGLKASVTIRGPNILLQQVLRSQPSFYVNVPDGVQRNFLAILNVDDLKLPLGVEVINLKPSKVELRFEKVIKKELGVVPTQIGAPAKGYRVVSLKVFPNKVYVEGPVSEFNQALQLKTAEINLDGMESSKRIELPIRELGRLMTYNVNMVSVEIEIAPIVEQKVFKNLSITVLNPQDHTAVSKPAKVNVALSGPTNIVGQLQASDINLFVDARSLTEGTHLLKVEANLPDQVAIISTDPGEISLTVVRTPTN